MIRAMHHTGMCVRDMERSLAFYRDLLGMEVTIDSRITGPDIEKIMGLEGVDVRRVYLYGYGGRVELFEYASPVGKAFPEDFGVNDVGISHIAFEVENLQGLYEELSAQGVRFNNPPLPVKGRGMVCYLKDPDGITLELLELFTPGT